MDVGWRCADPPCSCRRCLRRRSSVRRSWLRLHACPRWCQGGWRSVNVDATVADMCTAVTTSVWSGWCCFARRSRGQRLTVCRCYDGGSTVRSALHPRRRMYTACRLREQAELSVLSTILDEKEDNVEESSFAVDVVPPAIDAPSRRLRPRDDCQQRQGWM